jgi:hypothetical protein
MAKKKQKTNLEKAELYNSILNSTVSSGSLEGIVMSPQAAQEMLRKVLIKIGKSV